MFHLLLTLAIAVLTLGAAHSSAQTQAACAAYLATDPSPSGIPSVSGTGVQQRAAFLAQGGKLVALDGRYYAVFIPPAFYSATNPVVIVDLHGTAGYPEAEWNDWHAAMSAQGYAFISLAWGGGTPSALSDAEIYDKLKQIVSEVGVSCPIAGASKWLMGFSVGSAFSFAVMIRDTADQRMFRGQLAVSGAAIGPLTTGKDVMHSTVEASRSTTGAVAGISAWMYCGEQDFDHGWSMCEEMPNGESFVTSHGGEARLYRDSNGQHHSLPSNPAATSDMFGYIEAASGGSARAGLKDAIYLYGLSLNGTGDTVLSGIDCDVFQLVLDVTSGQTSLAMGQGNTLSSAIASQTVYPDRITSAAAMFAYALFQDRPAKSFVFNDKDNPASAAEVGKATVFGYCYSNKPGAHVYLQQKANCLNTYSDGHTASCTSSDNGAAGGTGSTGDLALRDAIYLYGQALNARGDKVLAGENCDVLQLVLDVESGYTDLAMGQASSLDAALATQLAYPDRIHDSADMFSYALDADMAVKSIAFNDKSNPTATARTGSVTAFGYCYSTNPAGRVYFRQRDQCLDQFSNGRTEAISGCVK